MKSRRKYISKRLHFSLDAILIILIIISHTIFESCNNKSKKEVENKKEKRYDFQTFSIFKQNLSYNECIKLLTKNRIEFKTIETPSDSLFMFLFTINYNLKKNKKFKFIEGYNLPVIDDSISKFQIIFYNDTIFNFAYNRSIETVPNNELNKNKISAFNTNAMFDTHLLQIISDGLHYKYGWPSIKSDDLNACNRLLNIIEQLEENPLKKVTDSTEKFMNYSTDEYDIKVYFGDESWINTNYSMTIKLASSCEKQSKRFKHDYNFTSMSSSINVCFNNEIAAFLEKEQVNQFELNQKNENKDEKLKQDSITNSLHKKYNKL